MVLSEGGKYERVLRDIFIILSLLSNIDAESCK